MQCDFRGFFGPDDRALGPIREDSIRVRAQVVLSSGPSRKFEMSTSVGMRCVGVRAVGGLNGHARVCDGLPVRVIHSPFDRSESARKLRLSRSAER